MIHLSDTQAFGHVRIVTHLPGFIGIMEYQAWIDSTRASGTRETVKRSKAHRCVEGKAVLDRAD